MFIEPVIKKEKHMCTTLIFLIYKETKQLLDFS
jgi:hypothetical protein